MTASVDRVITSLRREHESLAALVADLDEGRLAAGSGADAWSVAQVLSHLGSGAEISAKPIAHASGVHLSGADEDNQSVWDRWDATSPAGQASGFVEHDAAYLDLVEGLSPEQCGSLDVDLGFLPAPVPLLVALGMRLNEVANHSWDVRVALDPEAEVDGESAGILMELFRGPLAFLLGFSTRPDQLDGPVRLAVPGGGVEIGDAVTVAESVVDPDATLSGAPGAAVRLLSGRLRPPHTHGVEVTGAVTLDDLRRVFPGY